MSILVTGGAGFIGSSLCTELINRGHHVICMDNFSTGNQYNISHLIPSPNFKLLTHDITIPFDLDNITISQIYHLGCPASPQKYQKNPMKTIKTSIIGTLNILKIAKHQNAKFLFSSTSEIYGDPLIHPQHESYNGNVSTISPRACYDESKRMCETIIYEYKNKHNLDLKIARIFNTYGPNMSLDDGRVVSNFINQILNNKPITIYGDGTQTRSLCYITDMVDGLIKLMESDIFGPVNLGNPDCEISMNELSHILKGISHIPLSIIYEPLPIDDPKQRKPDITLARTALQWSPEINIVDGLRMCLESFCYLTL